MNLGTVNCSTTCTGKANLGLFTTQGNLFQSKRGYIMYKELAVVCHFSNECLLITYFSHNNSEEDGETKENLACVGHDSILCWFTVRLLSIALYSIKFFYKIYNCLPRLDLYGWEYLALHLTLVSLYFQGTRLDFVTLVVLVCCYYYHWISALFPFLCLLVFGILTLMGNCGWNWD